MNRLQVERDYWDNAALDPDVDTKYICDLPTRDCLKDLGDIKGVALEIGCGVGRLMKKGAHGIDVSPKMLEIAKQRRPDCHFRVTDGTIPYDDKTFDTVYSMLVFQHLKRDEVENYIKEAYRVLRGMGVFKFQYIDGDEDEPFSIHHSTETLRDFVFSAGFNPPLVRMSGAYPNWRWMEVQKL